MQGVDKIYVRGGQALWNGKKDKQNIPYDIQKRAGRYPKLYTG